MTNTPHDPNNAECPINMDRKFRSMGMIDEWGMDGSGYKCTCNPADVLDRKIQDEGGVFIGYAKGDPRRYGAVVSPGPADPLAEIREAVQNAFIAGAEWGVLREGDAEAYAKRALEAVK